MIALGNKKWSAALLSLRLSDLLCELRGAGLWEGSVAYREGAGIRGLACPLIASG
jgi:hypothetical protein